MTAARSEDPLSMERSSWSIFALRIGVEVGAAGKDEKLRDVSEELSCRTNPLPSPSPSRKSCVRSIITGQILEAGWFGSRVSLFKEPKLSKFMLVKLRP